MRVLIIAFDTEEASVRLASGLAGQVTSVDLILPARTVQPHLHLLHENVHLHVFPKPRLRQALSQVRTMVRILRLIRRIDPDVIHFQKGHLWFNLTLPLLARYPLVVSIHDPRHHTGDKGSRNTPQAIFDFGYRRAHRVIAHNAAMKSVIERDLRIPAERIHVLPLIERGHGIAEPSVAEDEHMVLFHGRIWAYKGLEYFIRAQPLVNAEVPEARFVIAGTGDDMAPYRAMMSDPARFEVHDEYVSYELREELVARSAVVVLPYLEATQSGVIPVAYTHRKPVVATTVGGLPEQVEDGVTGFLVPPADASALAEKIVLLLRSPELRKRLGENGHLKQQREWSAEVIAKRTVPVYRAAIDARHAHVGPSVSRNEA